MDLFGRYMLPLLLYQLDNDFVRQHRHKLQMLGRILLPLSQLINVLTSTQCSITIITLSLLSAVINAVGQSWWPIEVVSFFNVLRLILAGEFNDVTAGEIGASLGIIFGGVSAKALGKFLSSCLIPNFPKLKKEPPVETNNQETGVIKHIQASTLGRRR